MLFLLTVLTSILAFASSEETNPFKEAYSWIEKVNSNPHSTWKAGQNFDPTLPASYIKKLLGLKRKNRPSILPRALPINDINDKDIPKEFDSRKKWKYCKSLQEIRDQGACGSCWAVAATSAFTDRLCIATKGKFNGHLSANELLACCSECGDGCGGGYDDAAWEYFKNHGVVTGGDYNSSEGCQPYQLQPCEHHVEGPRPQCSSLEPTPTPPCETKCLNKKYRKPFNKDHHKVKSSYSVPSSVAEIQKEILKHGPVEAGFIVYTDFLSYKSGVYQPSPSSTSKGGHAVKLIGWGVEKNTPYWLVQNSWNSDWGDKGLFKILRGKNTCGFESEINAGIPK
ncbi:cathepsin B-like cysteine proteinase 3 [Lycorma delicatula]|uniref:cathepsin B-like cysteine proteinase 3 n=1 Tax=Lycorma delicatula TaxID=130591 RepID=UPI003F513D64